MTKEQIIEEFEKTIHGYHGDGLTEVLVREDEFIFSRNRMKEWLESSLSSLQESTESRVREEERIKIFEDLEALAIEWEEKGFNDIFELQAYYDYKKSLLQDPKKQ